MKKSILITAAILAYCILITANCFSQGTAINKTGAAADQSAILDLSDTTKGILIPRMKKVNKLAIASPATGLMVYQTDDTTGFWYYNGTKWLQALGSSGGSGSGTGGHHVGEFYGGGMVFFVYTDLSGTQHGLIVGLTDISTSTGWTAPAYQTTLVPPVTGCCPGCTGFVGCSACSGGASSDRDGLCNTNAIIAQGGSSTAAWLALNYNNPFANSFPACTNCTSWYLPSNWELNLLYQSMYTWDYSFSSMIKWDYLIRENNLYPTAYIPSSVNYWSSTEIGFQNVIVRSILSNSLTMPYKYENKGVRAIRRF